MHSVGRGCRADRGEGERPAVQEVARRQLLHEGDLTGAVTLCRSMVQGNTCSLVPNEAAGPWLHINPLTARGGGACTCNIDLAAARPSDK